MKPHVPFSAVSVFAVCLLGLSSVCGAADDDDARLSVIDRELSCVSNHVEQGVQWDDVCYTSPEGGLDKDRLVTKSMDQMIEENNAAADDLSAGRTVDSISQEHGAYADSAKSVDDAIQEQGMGNQDAPLESPNQELDSSQANAPQYVQYAKNYSNDTYEPDDDLTPQGSLSTPSRSLTDRLDNQNKSEIGLEYNRQRYVEPIFDLVDKGSLFGAYVAYTARPGKNDALFDDIIDMYRGEMRFNYGHMDYSSSGSGKIKDIPDFVFETRLLAGKDFKVLADSRLTPYLGFGFRYLNDDSGGKVSTTGAAGYERESRYFYIPLGIEFTTRIAEGWLVTPTFEYDILVSGTQTSHLSDANAGLPDVKNKQRNGRGLRGSLKFVKESNPVSFVFEPYIRYWHIEDSDVTTATGPSFIVSGMEPENETTEYGVRLGAEF